MVKYSRNHNNISIQPLRASEWKFCSLWVYLFTIPPAKNTVNLRENLLYCPTIVLSMEGRLKWDSIFFSPLCPQFIRSTWSKSISLDRTSNSLESGWDWITNRGEPLSGHFPLSFSLSPSPLRYLNKMGPSMFSSISERRQIHYFWLSFSVTWTCPSGLVFVLGP